MTDCVTNVLQREKVKGLRERKPFTLLSGPTWTRTIYTNSIYTSILTPINIFKWNLLGSKFSVRFQL
jgi:hypothetical protein